MGAAEEAPARDAQGETLGATERIRGAVLAAVLPFTGMALLTVLLLGMALIGWGRVLRGRPMPG